MPRPPRCPPPASSAPGCFRRRSRRCHRPSSTRRRSPSAASPARAAS
uniref:Uncharacterized protein n=1 Tax=Arundo donax TaxID=35708 RepID=A0A0A9E0B7_ARUDO